MPGINTIFLTEMIITNKLKIEIDEKTGDIISILDGRDYEYLAYSMPIIRLKLLDEFGKRITVVTESLTELKTNGKGATLIFRDIGGIKVSCSLDIINKKDSFVFSLSVKNESGLIFESANYPNIALKDNLIGTGGKHKLFWSAMEGVEVINSDLKTKIFTFFPDNEVLQVGWCGMYPAANQMQFLSYYDDEKGLYFGAHDDKANFKYIEWYVKDSGLCVYHEVFPEHAFDKEFSIGYDVVLQGFDGDSWYEGADIYAKWLYSTDIIKMPTYNENPRYPKWLKDNPIVITYPVRGEIDNGNMDTHCFYPYTDGLKYIKKYNDLLGVKALVLLMHWEGTAPWAPPYVWPPFGDSDNFKKFDEELHKQGNKLGLYCSGSSWTEYSGIIKDYDMRGVFDEQNLKEYMELYPDQSLRYSRVLGLPHRVGYDMCPSCEWVQKTLIDEANKIADNCQVDYIQFFDQNLGGGTCQCYSKNHDHQPVPGKWMAESMRNIMQSINKVFAEHHADRQILLGCEGVAAEPFINELLFNDMRFELVFNLGMPVHAYNYIFGKYLLNFMGNQNAACFLFKNRDYPDFMYYRYAYSFVQGDIITLILKDDGKIAWQWTVPWDDEPDQKEISSFIKEIVAWKNGILNDIFKKGTMVKPNKVSCSSFDIKIHTDGDIQPFDEIVTNKYEMDGEFYQIFVNVTGKNREFTVGAQKLLLLDKDGAVKKELSAVGGTVSVCIKPRDIVLAKIK